MRKFFRHRAPRYAVYGVALVVVVFVANEFFVHLVHTRIYERELTFVDDTPLDVLKKLKQNTTAVSEQGFAPLETPSPFVEVDAFDDDAMSWSNLFSQYGAAGLLIFDANGDDRLDVYFVQDGQNWTRPTDENAVLLDEPRYQHNGLYLNQGNDENGYPIFRQLGELARTNDRFVTEELLIEDYLFPRQTASDSEKRWGRSSNVAVAADFNNDGRLDVLVGNEPQGMMWSHPKTQSILSQFVNPVGREARKSKQPLTAQGLYFIDYEARHSLQDTRESARGIEPEGANSLYLNMGDADGDGLPEWRDASRETGIEGFRCTYSLSVADIDLDGDLDVFVGNTMDMDYWVGGAEGWAGGANELFVNQLAETGELRFIDRAAEMDVDGVYDEDNPMPDYYKLRRIPLLPPEYSFLSMKFVPYKPEPLVINGQQGEQGQISWSAVLQDVNEDGYADVWVANDMGYIRLYLNQEGRRFVQADHARSEMTGYWMSFAAGDFNRDLKEDLFAGNMGGALMNHAIATPDPFDGFEPTVGIANNMAQFFNNKADSRHGLIDGADWMREMPNLVRHSTILPPDVTIPNNYRRHAPPGIELPPFDPNALNAYEFAWGAAAFDAQNDGRLDLYFLGSLYGRGGGILTIAGTGPGRFLVNATEPDGELRFVDLTAEHHLFDIEELQYDSLKSKGYIYRKAPRQNWGKRDMVYSYDRGNWALQGPGIQERVTNQDLIQTAENGRAVVAADVNGDGFSDVLLRNLGGYDSRSSEARNLQAMFDGRPRVLPAHNYNYPTPTNYEPGSSRLFINAYTRNNWLKVRLIDDAPGSLNRDALGARVVVNDRYIQVKRSGEGGFISNKFEDLHFGLADSAVHSIVVHWPDKERTVTRVSPNSIRNTTVVISKTRGLVTQP